MAQKQCWYADQGPFLYESDNLYPDAVPKEGGRVPQAMIENAPAEYYHVARKSELDSVAASLVTGTIDSVARSKAESASTRAGTADSKSVSVGAADSTSTSVANSQDTSQGVRLSVIESKLTSGGW